MTQSGDYPVPSEKVDRKENATQADVDAALAEVEDAMKKVLVKPGDKTEIIAAIEAAKKLDKKNYDTSAMTWNVFQKSIEDAQAVVDDPNAAQGTVNFALETLKDNIKKLGEPVTNKPSTDKDSDDGEEDEDADVAETEAPTTEAPTSQAPATTPAPEKKGGCGSSVALSALAIVGVIGTAVVLKKRD